MNKSIINTLLLAISIINIGSITAIQKELPVIDKTLLEAAKSDNMRVITESLQNGASALARDEYGFTPLHWSAHHGNIDAIKLLLSFGAIAEDSQNREHITPTQSALKERHTFTAKLLTDAANDQAEKRYKIMTNDAIRPAQEHANRKITR